MWWTLTPALSRRVREKRRWNPAWLAVPYLVLVFLAFVVPFGVVLVTAVRDPELAGALPRSAVMLRDWDGVGLPPDAVFPVVSGELVAAERDQAIGALTRRLNFERTGMRALLLRTARAGARERADMVALDGRWGEPATWGLLRRAAGPWTGVYLLRALDLRRDDAGRVAALPAEQALFRAVFARTFGIAGLVTVLTLVVAYPVAATLAGMGGAWGRAGLALVLMPLWISVLVRTAAWFILLQREGPVNALLMASGVVAAPVQLMFTRFAVDLSMAHVLLPFAVLPLYAVMRGLDPALLQAARGMGAPGWQVWWRVHLPLSLPGVQAAGGIVFLIAVGFWVTTALVGGPSDQMAGSFVAAYVNETLNWGMAGALATVLLGGTAAVLAAARAALRVVR